MSLGLKRHLCRTRTRTRAGHNGGKKAGPPRAQLEERKQTLKKIWQLEPLFLVLFLKSIIRNFQYRNNPSKPFKSFVQEEFHIRSTRTSVHPCEPPTPTPHPCVLTQRDRHTVITKVTPPLGLDVQLSEAMMVSSLGWQCPGPPSSYCLKLQALPHWHHLNAQNSVPPTLGAPGPAHVCRTHDQPG